MRALAAAMLLAAGPACAQEFVSHDGAMSDRDFYRAVACAAPPGGACQKPIVRWRPAAARRLRVGLAAIDPGFADYKLAAVLSALQSAIAEINGAGSDVRLVSVLPGAPSDIGVFLTGADSGTVFPAQMPPAILEGREITAGNVVLRTDAGQITHAFVALSRDISRRAIASVVLEELTQALGLVTDLRNPAYRRVSIFDEDGNSVTRLGPQDRMALQRHYPPGGG